MEFSVWDAFHDGSVIDIESRPGSELLLVVEIPYLREMFKESGTCFNIVLSKVKELRFTPYDGSSVSNLAEIVGYEPEILNSEKVNDGVLLMCVNGQLTVQYESAVVFLDNGRLISDEELLSASKRYWDNFSVNVRRTGNA